MCAVYVWPYFSLLNTRDPALITLAIVVALGVVHPLMYGPQGGFFADMFDVQVRFSGVSIGAIGAVVGGGINPVICSSLLAHRAGDPSGVALYITISALIAACFVALAPRVQRRGTRCLPVRRRARKQPAMWLRFPIRASHERA